MPIDPQPGSVPNERSTQCDDVSNTFELFGQLAERLSQLLHAEPQELSDAEKRFLFRELAKQLLDPRADSEFTICDNDQNVLGYFDPVARRMRSKTEQFSVPVDDFADLLEGSEPFEDLINRTIRARQPDGD